MHYLAGYRNNYKNKTWTIEQNLGHISLYIFEGQFSEALTALKEKEKEITKIYLSGPITIRLRNCVPSFDYKTLSVTFDRIFIEVGPGEDRENELHIWGSRSPTAAELEWLEADRLKNIDVAKEIRRKEYEKMKNEFENEDT